MKSAKNCHKNWRSRMKDRLKNEFPFFSKLFCFMTAYLNWISTLVRKFAKSQNLPTYADDVDDDFAMVVMSFDSH